jgi:hypothetical protein
MITRTIKKAYFAPDGGTDGSGHFDSAGLKKYAGGLGAQFVVF